MSLPKMNFKNQKGAMLVQVLVISAICLVFAAIMAQGMLNGLKVNRSIDAKLNASRLEFIVLSAIGSTELCATSLGGQSPMGSLVLDPTTLKAGAQFDKDVNIVDIRIMNQLPFSATFTQSTLEVSYEKPAELLGRKSGKLFYSLYFNVDASGNIDNCIGGEIQSGNYYCSQIGGTWSGGLCKYVDPVLLKTCNILPGYSISGTSCVLTCPSGFYLDSTGNACIPDCPAGTHKVSEGVCEDNVIKYSCPINQTLNSSNICV